MVRLRSAYASCERGRGGLVPQCSRCVLQRADAEVVKAVHYALGILVASMVESRTNDPQLQWIYEGTKSLVNREDYLLGKKVDKNFELYSDAVINEKESGIEAIEKPRPRISDASSKISNLEVDVVRTEDPLVAIKLKEEKIRQEKMENPLVKLKMQKMLKKAMEKKERKRLKKQKKLEKKQRHKHDSSDSGDGGRNERNRRHHDVQEKDTVMPSSSSEPSSNTEKEKRRTRRLQRDSHIPEHLRPKYSSSSESDGGENESRKLGREKYGLLKVAKEKLERSEEGVNPYKSLPKKRFAEPYKRPEKRKLTDEEMEAKRREMMENADWRDQVRVHNIKKSAQRDEDEDRRNEGKAANFIRPMLNSAASTMTVEQQLNSHRRGLQRTGGFTEQKFTKR